MISISFKNKFKVLNISISALLLLLLLPFNKAYAISGSFTSSTGVASATVVEQALEIEDINTDLVFELTVEVGEEDNQWFNKEKVVSRMEAEPDTTMKIYYGDDALSKEDNTENDSGFAIVTLISDLGDRLQVKLKIDNSQVVFDENGTAELKVDSEFLVGENQPKGSYKAIYYVVITH